MDNKDLTPPTEEDLISALNGWPEGTVGYEKEKKLIKELNTLGRKHGYGRLNQLTEMIEDLYRNPENLQNYKNERLKHIKLLEQTIKHIKEEEK